MTDRLRVTDDQVRLRSGPGTQHPVLAELAAGTMVEPTSGHAWREVRLGDQVGWVAAPFLAPAADDEPAAGPPRYTFDPATPTYRQRLNWTCAIGSVIWCLRSIGIAVTPEEAHDAMVGPYVDARGADGEGLLEASGAGIVRVLAEQWGVTAYNDPAATFDELANLAGRMPVAFGLRRWGLPGGHWSALRGFDGERLVLANPAGSGPRYGHETLTSTEFDARGPASCVVIPLG